MRVLFGGTFDPVHLGHLRMAEELADLLAPACVDMLPCYKAVHKQSVSASPAARVAMLEAAIADNKRLRVDTREIKRSSPSYTIDTLREVRAEIGDQPLFLAVGTDAAAAMQDWRESQAYAGLCHVILLDREGRQGHEAKQALKALGFTACDGFSTLKSSPCAHYIDLKASRLDISSTDIRRRINENQSIRYLVKDAVLEFICDNQLYRL